MSFIASMHTMLEFSRLRGVRKLRAWVGLLLGLGLAFSATAMAPDTNFQVRGFGTVGVVRTNTDHVEFVRDLSQPRGATNAWTAKVDSVVGLQADWRLTPQWQVVLQGISRYRYDDSFKPEVSWAFVKYEPRPNLALRAGRLGTDFFMLADSRWVGYSYLTVRPPGDYFWYLPFYSIHGGDVALSVPYNEAIIRAKAFYGVSQGRIPLADEQWQIKGSPMLGAYLEYQCSTWQVRASYANVKFKHDLPLAPVLQQEGLPLLPADAELLKSRNTRSHYYALGVVYDNGPLQAQLLLNHIRQGSQAFESSDAGYLLLGYRQDAWTPFIGVSRVISKKRDRPMSQPIAALVVMPDARAIQTTYFAGARWDLAKNTALKVQMDVIRGHDSSIFPYRRDNRQQWGGKMNVYSMSLDFVF
jgi:hypothetical protein